MAQDDGEKQTRARAKAKAKAFDAKGAKSKRNGRDGKRSRVRA